MAINKYFNKGKISIGGKDLGEVKDIHIEYNPERKIEPNSFQFFSNMFVQGTGSVTVTEPVPREYLRKVIDTLPVNDNLFDTIVISESVWETVKGAYGVETIKEGTDQVFRHLYGFKVYTYNNEKEFNEIISRLKHNKVKYRVIV